MSKLNKLNSRGKIFITILILGFLFKYNFLFLRILYVPSISGLILRNIAFMAIFILLLLPLGNSKKGRIFLFLLSIAFTSMFMSNFWYNRYFGNFLSVNDMILGEGTGTFSLFSVLLRHIIRPYDILFILDIFLLAFFIPRMKKSNYRFSMKGFQKSASSFYYKKRKAKVPRYALIVVLLFSQILITNYLLDNKNPLELYQDSTIKFANVYGLLPLYAIEVYDYLSPDSFISSEIEAVKLRIDNNIDSEPIIENMPNIIAIQLESLDEKLMDYKYEGIEINPFLNNLKKESLYFNNFYAQHVNGSFDADLSFLTSLYPINRNYAFRENDFSNLGSLAKILKEKGYQTLAFHGNDKSFFNRDLAFPDLGFNKFYSLEDYQKDNLKMDVEDKLGLNDYDFFHQSLDLLEGTEEPFFAFFISLTSHTPFYFYPPEQAKEEFSNIDNRLVQDFFNSIAFLDKSMEMFFQGLEERGLKEDTLFIIYSDHESDINTELYSSPRNFNLKRNVKAPEHVPLLIIHPDIESGINERLASFTDIAPTILDILGIESIPETFVGRSLLRAKEWPVLFLHENPQILYKDQLFVRQQGEFEKIGYLDKAKEDNVVLSEEQKEWIEQVIYYMRNVVFSRSNNIFGGVQ
ncbi:LTA synthase family protein [Natronospora cellulosivora (SeqCode)]